MLDQLSRALLALAAPHRAAAAADAMQRVQQQLQAALATEAGENNAALAAALAPVLCDALRLLITQSKLVKLEAANARLSALAAMMKERGAVAYLRGKLAAAWKLPGAGPARSVDGVTPDGADQQRAPSDTPEQLTPELLRSKLPRSSAWLAGARGEGIPGMQQALAAAGLAGAAAAGASPSGIAGSMVPELRSGLRQSPSSRMSSPRDAPAGGGAAGSAATIKALYPVDLDGWRGVLRAGLLALVSADTPAAGPALPELLQVRAASRLLGCWRQRAAAPACRVLLATGGGGPTCLARRVALLPFH